MELSNKAVSEFQEIYLKEFGEKISKKEAEEKGKRLLKFMQVVYKPLANIKTDEKEKQSTS